MPHGLVEARATDTLHSFPRMSAFDSRVYGATASREMSRIDYQVLSANYQALREELASAWQRYEMLAASYNELQAENNTLKTKKDTKDVPSTDPNATNPAPWALPPTLQTITPRQSFDSAEEGRNNVVRSDSDGIKRPLQFTAAYETSGAIEPKTQHPPKKRTKICEQCGAGFPDNWKLNRHVTRKHK